MFPRRGAGPGTAANAKIERSGAAIPQIRSPIPPTPVAGGPKPSARFGAHTAWAHFFQMVALGGGPTPHQHLRTHERSKSEGDAKAVGKMTVTTTETSDHLPLLKNSVHGHLEKIFAMLRGRAGDYILRERLEDFLVETQGGLVRPLEKDTYTLGDFVYIWLHDYSKALRPARPKDLSKPISNYFISSSHNTYIGLGNQLNGEVSAQAYRTVLEGDCRCVEIDVWNGEGWTESRTRTPSRSKSPPRSNPGQRVTHTRHLSNLSTTSTTSIPAAEPLESLVDIMDAKWRELTGAKLERTKTRKHRSSQTASASMSQLDLTLPCASYSTTSLENDLLDPNDIGGSPLRHARSAESLRFTARGRTPPRSYPRSASKESRRRIEPEVTHAHTVQGIGDVGLARRISLREVCRVIRESAFKTNKLPLIVSLEVHATGEQQDMMVDIMKEEWGDHLLDQRLADCNPNEKQPRLEELLEKILVKVKRAPTIGLLSTGGSQLTVPMVDEDGSASEDERVFADDAFTKNGHIYTGVKTAKTKIGEILGRLAIYTHSEHYKDFSRPEAKTPSHIFSVDEYKILRLHQTKHREMFIHNRRYFMRAYPHSSRVNSTNLNPSLYWRKGVQMAALNWQRSSVDEAMMLNSAMFESEQGWVLKPEGYLSDDITISQAQAGHHRTLTHFRITILAGQFVPLPGEADLADEARTVSSVCTTDGVDFRPFIKCELHVETPEERNENKAIKGGVLDGQYKLVSKSSETENPDWGAGQVLEFPPNIDNVVEELSFLR
ncbi:unnamed protein product [Discula destructiva]